MLLTVPVNWPLGLTDFSSNWLASPLLSPLIKWFVLFMEVGWTANQLITPIGSFVSEWNMFIWWTPWSVSCSYLETKQCTSPQYVKEYPDLVNHCGYSYSLACIWLSIFVSDWNMFIWSVSCSYLQLNKPKSVLSITEK